TDPATTRAFLQEGIQGYSRSARPEREAHGGEWETSLALYRIPELVDQEAARWLEPNLDYDVEAFHGETQDYWTLTGGRGYFGSPAAASADTGRKVTEVRSRNLARIILQKLGKPEETR
ncbi:MAG: creatininase family protein, partial [Deltaproteobacteria bacterium]|nr:creatininase family protein [Deltaproteobacteria bacterium]